MRTSELPRQSRLNVPLATLRKQKAMLERSAVTLAVKDAARTLNYITGSAGTCVLLRRQRRPHLQLGALPL